MAAAARAAYCTLLTSDAYLPGAMVLAHSLRDAGTKEQLAVLVTLDNLQASTIHELKKAYGQIIPVDRIINRSPANLYLMDRPDLISTFTKINLWKQTQYEHIVYIDADIVALRAPDELFKNPPSFAAVPDIGWPDCFNSGVLSLKPNMGDYYALLALADRGISFDGADQGLLNMHFRDWKRLSFAYNCTPSGNYQYVPAYRHFQSSISMVHYIGHDKPWTVGREYKQVTGVYEELLGRWWAVYDKHYRSTTAYLSGQATKPDSRTVQQYVAGEATSTSYGFSSVGTGEVEDPHIEEPPLTDKTDLAEKIEKDEVETAPTIKQRRYSVDWDPQHQAPPTHSRPEAANFPHAVYNMSSDRSLFVAPEVPEPPKGMYYEAPKSPRSPRLPPIFPWEKNQRKAARVFPDDLPPKPTPSLSTPSTTTDNDEEASPTVSPSTPTNVISSPNFTRTNAWDEIPEINRYISSLPQNRRAKVQVLINNTVQTPPGSRTPTGADALTSPGLPGQDRRRPSMKLTDFPTEIERPSLPVTPAPVRRPSFWGAERDAAGHLPPAEGVPDQSEWNPGERLTELARRQSKVLEDGPMNTTGGRIIPDREVIGSASIPLRRVREEEANERRKEDKEEVLMAAAASPPPSTASASGPAPGVAPPPVFGALNFAGGDGASEGGRVTGNADEYAVGPNEEG